MCGIAGYVSKKPNSNLLEDFNQQMIHRGPDDAGIYRTSLGGIGMRRLAIVDLKTGQQPVFSSDGSAALVFNGEIYNHQQLRRELESRGSKFLSEGSDTEVLIRMYEQFGADFLHQLDGMFAIAIIDNKAESLFLARDRIGERPLYYYVDDKFEIFYFCSEFGPLKNTLAPLKTSTTALAWYFSQKGTPKKQSIDARIKKLAPGSSLTFRPGSHPIIKSYYKPSVKTKELTLDKDRVVDRLDELIQSSVRLRMRADVEVGAFLSGGIDSSLIAVLASQQAQHPLQTYCLVYDDPVNHKNADRIFSNQIARTIRANHVEVLLTPDTLMEELPKIVRQHAQPNSAVISTWFVAKAMSRNIKVALSGDGADELFGSYFLHRTAAYADALKSADTKEWPIDEKERQFVLETEGLSRGSVIDRFGVFTDSEITQLLAPLEFQEGSIIAELDRRYHQLESQTRLN